MESSKRYRTSDGRGDQPSSVVVQSLLRNPVKDIVPQMDEEINQVLWQFNPFHLVADGPFVPFGQVDPFDQVFVQSFEFGTS